MTIKEGAKEPGSRRVKPRRKKKKKVGSIGKKEGESGKKGERRSISTTRRRPKSSSVDPQYRKAS